MPSSSIVSLSFSLGGCGCRDAADSCLCGGLFRHIADGHTVGQSALMLLIVSRDMSGLSRKADTVIFASGYSFLAVRYSLLVLVLCGLVISSHVDFNMLHTLKPFELHPSQRLSLNYRSVRLGSGHFELKYFWFESDMRRAVPASMFILSALVGVWVFVGALGWGDDWEWQDLMEWGIRGTSGARCRAGGTKEVMILQITAYGPLRHTFNTINSGEYSVYLFLFVFLLEVIIRLLSITYLSFYLRIVRIICEFRQLRQTHNKASNTHFRQPHDINIIQWAHTFHQPRSWIFFLCQ